MRQYRGIFRLPHLRLEGLPLRLDRLDLLLHRGQLGLGFGSLALFRGQQYPERHRDHRQQDDQDPQPHVERTKLDKRARSEIELDAHQLARAPTTPARMPPGIALLL